MKTAYLINCHKDMLSVSRLAHRLHTENSHIFIHVDKKVSRDIYESLISDVSDLENCYVSSVRIDGKLDDRSLVDINIALVSFAKLTGQQNGVHYSYFAAMSGQDYPIKPIAFVEKELESNYPDLHMDCRDSINTPWISNKFNRNKLLIQYRNLILKCKISLIRKALQGVGVLMRKLLYLSGKTALQKINKKGWKIYGGSAWWVLPDYVIDAIEKDYNSKTEFATMMLDESTTPEETFFQSMVMHLFFSDNQKNNIPKMKIQHLKTFVDFGGKSGRPVVCHPYTITTEDYDRLCSSSCWFARKFDRNVDSEIFDKIDEFLL